jgi:hypothetical protein
MDDAVATQLSDERMHEEKETAKVIFSGTLAEGLVAGGAVILSIIGLIGAMEQTLLSVSVIALGAALLFEGAAISARFYELVSETTKDKIGMAELSAGTAAESLAGIFTIVLGILAIIGLRPLLLIPAAIIMTGGCLILGAGANARLTSLRIAKPEQHYLVREIARQAALSTTGFQVLVGMGAITLGILALADVEPLTLSLVAVLGISGSILLSGSALAGRMFSIFRF